MRAMREALRVMAAAGLLAAVTLTAAGDAQAQYRRPNFFEQLFGGGGGMFQQPGPPPMQQPRERAQPQQSDFTRAPPPRKSDKAETPPTTTVMVVGDSLADWLAYGLEDTFSDTPEVGVLRRHKTYSGLIRYENRGDLDWPHVARDLIAKDKPNFIVVMLGLNDRTPIREAPPPARKKEPAKDDKKDDKAKDEKKESDKEAAQKPGDGNAAEQNKTAEQDKADDEAEQSAIVAPEPPRGPRGNNEFRSDRWAELYSKKIDEMIAALKAPGVPVIWVGLPSIRGTRSTADALYLNDLFRARAQKAGIIYVDVWDGFVDENNRYSLHGPDVEGQTRRLRAYDGVHFTSYGARKLAHYVDREIRRLMTGRATPVALPSTAPGPDAGAATGPAARPLAGPVISLTGVPSGADELLGASRAPAPGNDPVAARVLVKGEPIAAPAGRADDFAWPRSAFGTAPAPAAAAPATAAPAAAAAAVAPLTSPPPAAEPTPPALPAAAPPPAVEPKPPVRRVSPPPAERRASGNGAAGAPPPRPPAAVMQQRPAQPRQPPAPQQRPNNGGGLFGLFR